ncbi:MAG: SDR family oxidoreductase, partial [Thermodesulfobacteriota bacterium]|nr:SDR family oxidoreductase [Thermodesulfobacteriota bacterium]
MSKKIKGKRANDDKVLIVGANGHLGHVVVETALENNYQVRAADTKTDRLDAMKHSGLEITQVDITKKETLAPLMDGVMGVISTVGLWRENPPATFDSVDRQGNINLFETAIQKGVKKAVYVSLLNAEKANKAKVMLAKRAVEQFLENSNLDYTVFRPSGLFHDFVEVFKPQILKGTVRGLGDGSLKMQPLSPKDLSRCMVTALKDQRASRAIFDIGGPESFTYHEAISLVSKVMGKEPKISYTPFWIAKALAHIINRIKPGSFLQPDWIEILTMDSVADVGKIKEV